MALQSKLRGIVPPLITPLAEDGSVDLVSLEAMIERQIGGGVHGVFALGSSGDVAYLTDTQREQVLSFVVEKVAGRVPVIAGIIDITTNRVIDQARRAADLGVDGLVATAPMYILTNMEEVERHFRAIKAAVDLPLYAYDLPVCVHIKLDGKMLVRLGVDGVLDGVKDSSGDDVAFRRLVNFNKAAGSPLTVLTGHEVMVDGMLLLGADGAVPGLGNVDPAGYVKMWDLAQEGKWAEVKEEQDRLAALFEIVFQASHLAGGASGVGSFKTSLNELGVISTNRMSTPAGRIDGETISKINAILAEAGVAQ